MRRNKQLFLHDPENMVYGDCHRTALSCLLDLSVVDAPHFIGEWEKREELKRQGLEQEPYDWQEEQEQWLNSLGYTTADILFGNGESDEALVQLEGLLGFMGHRNPHVYYLLGGRSPRGANHTVVCLGGGLEWDPHPDGGFLVGPMDHGFYEVTLLLPTSMKNRSTT